MVMTCKARKVPEQFLVSQIGGTGTSLEFAPAPPTGKVTCLWGITVALPASTTVQLKSGSTALTGALPSTGLQVEKPPTYIGGGRVVQAPMAEGNLTEALNGAFSASVTAGGWGYYSFEDP